VAEQVAGKQQVLHLDIEPGTALFNALLTYAVEQGWHDQAFIEQHTRGFAQAIKANRMSITEASDITGIAGDKLKQAAEWAYRPKPSGHRPRTKRPDPLGIEGVRPAECEPISIRETGDVLTPGSFPRTLQSPSVVYSWESGLHASVCCTTPCRAYPLSADP